MTSAQVLNVLLGGVFLSTFFLLVYFVQSWLSFSSRVRIIFLKAHIIALWSASILAFAILSVKLGQAIAELLPLGSNIDGLGLTSNAQMLLLEDNSFSWSFLILLLYFAGLVVMLIRFLRSYLQLRKTLVDSSSYLIEGQSVMASDKVLSPFSFGFFKPQIYVPKNFLQNNTKQNYTKQNKSSKSLLTILTHEATHIENRDPKWKLLSLLTKMIFYFSPAVWWLHQKIDLEIEIECDRLTLEKTSLSIEKYGNLLIDSVERLQPDTFNPMFTYMNNSHLKRRIEAMTTKTISRPLLTGIFATLAVTASLSAVATTSGVSRLKNQYKITAQVFVGEKLISTPRIIALANEMASIESASEESGSVFKISVIASEADDQKVKVGIKLDMEVDYQSKDQTYHAKPKMVVASGEEGLIEIGSRASETLKIKLIAIRQ